MKPAPESKWYGSVATWLTEDMHCFRYRRQVTIGEGKGRVDLMGLRDSGGDVSDDVEVIAVEVKKGVTPFGKACGQTLSYRTHANRIYLADRRSKGFLRSEVDLASALGIGLLQITIRNRVEVLSSPYYHPFHRHLLSVVESLGCQECRMCGDVFDITGKRDQVEMTGENDSWDGLARWDSGHDLLELLGRRKDAEKGVIFWNGEVEARKRRFKAKVKKSKLIYERRFLCPECVERFLTPFMTQAERARKVDDRIQLLESKIRKLSGCQS